MQWSRTKGTLFALALAVPGAACYAPPGPLHGGRGVLFTDGPVAGPEAAPRVRLFTEYEASGVSRVRTRLRLEDDAYVLVLNVAPDGDARIVFPGSPDDRGFLRGGQTYALEPFFSGYPTIALASTNLQTRFVRYQHSSFASTATLGPGYTFVLAARRPFDLVALADAGLFDGVDAGASVVELSPDRLIPELAELALGDEASQPVRADWARYAGYDPIAGARTAMYAYSGESMYGYPGLSNYCSSGYVTRWALAIQHPGFGLVDGMCPGGVYLGPPATRPPAVQPPDSSSADSASTDGAKKFRPRNGPVAGVAAGAVVLQPRVFTPRDADRAGGAGAVELTPETRPQMRRRDAVVERRMARETTTARTFEARRRRDAQDAATSAPSGTPDRVRAEPRSTPAADRPSPRSARGKSAPVARDAARSGTVRSSNPGKGPAGPRPRSRVHDAP